MNLRKLVSHITIAVVVAAFALVSGVVNKAEAGDKYVKLGAVFSETGPASFLGHPEKLTAEMLVDQINAAGGVNGYKIKLIALDTQGNEQRTINHFKRLVFKEKVLAIVGPSRSGSTLAIKQMADQKKVPLISASASARITTPVSKYVFKTPQSDTHAAAKIFDHMKAKGMKTAALMTAQNGFGASGLAALEKISKEMGIKIVASEKFGDKDKDMTAQLAKIKGQNPDAVICWGVGPAPALVAKNAAQLGLKNIFMSHGVASPKFIQLAGKAAEGIILPAGRLIVADQLADGDKYKPVLMDYKKMYEKKTGEPVSTFGGHAYDAVMLFKLAFEKSGNDRDKLAEELAKIKNFTGTAGVFNMSATDHNGLTMDAFIMVQIKDGKFVIAK